MAAPKVFETSIDKLVHGGQGLGTLADGKKALIWNALPGEKVRFVASKKKSSYIEGFAQEILESSAERVGPRDALYLSTSPWQIMTYEAENKYKQSILSETLQRAGVAYGEQIGFYARNDPWHYRNKMEYSFFGDDDGLHLALFNRGSHRKQIVDGSSIARAEIDTVANAVCGALNDAGVRAGDLKTLVVRCNREGQCVAALFVKKEDFHTLDSLDNICKGVAVYYSNPKSPASVPTRQLYTIGDTTLSDKVLGQELNYDVLSFFQVNLDPYEEALRKIRQAIKNCEVTDMYAGVGSIGLVVTPKPARLIEIDSGSTAMARLNAEKLGRSTEVIEAASEKAVDYIPAGDGQAVIFDPPRAGLHEKVTNRVLENLPEKTVYLSCNPSTFARDLAILQSKYVIKSLNGYNFFPRTPHIEVLAVLERKS